jgi:hypothetical protein
MISLEKLESFLENNNNSFLENNNNSFRNNKE